MIIIGVMVIVLPADVFATQLHKGNEGIIVHQIGHVFFLFSMIALIFTITGKNLGNNRGWRLIQYSAFLFVLWNIDALAAHFFDNMICAVHFERLSLWKINIITKSNSTLLAMVYYILKLDHLLCLPAMFLLYKGIQKIVMIEKQKISGKDYK
jgi:hypothetical protein